MNCPSLKIIFLGTGTSSGVPMIACDCEVCTSTDKKDNRLRPSILIQSATTTIVVDTTPDFRYQMLRKNIKQLDAVLFTHPHKDHIAGLDDIRAFNYFYKPVMPIYVNELTEKGIKREFEYIFSGDKYPGIPNVNLITIPEETFFIGDIPVTPIKTWHHKMPVLGFRFGKFTYITDANKIDEKEKIKGSEIIVLNALRKQHHIAHFTLNEATDLVTELQIPNAYFTHISHQMGKHQQVELELPDGMHLAYDGLCLKLDS